MFIIQFIQEMAERFGGVINSHARYDLSLSTFILQLFSGPIPDIFRHREAMDQ